MKLAVAFVLVAVIASAIFVSLRDSELVTTRSTEASQMAREEDRSKLAPIEPSPSSEPTSTRESNRVAVSLPLADERSKAPADDWPIEPGTWLEGVVRDVRGAPVSGVDVVLAIPLAQSKNELGPFDSGFIMATFDDEFAPTRATTDDAGRFRVGSDEAFAAQSRATLFVRGCGIADFERELILDANRTRRDYDVVVILREVEVWGTVVDARGAPVAGALVQVIMSRDERGTTWPGTNEPRPVVSASSAETTDWNSIAEAPFSWTADRVRAQVTSILSTGGQVACEPTDEKGIFRAPCARTDRVEAIEFSAPGHPPIRVARQDITGPLAGLKLSFPEGSTVRGRVVDEHGVSIANTRVQACRTDEMHWFAATSITDATGRYELDTLPQGELMIEVWREPHEDGRWRPWAGVIVSLEAGETRETDITLGASPSFPSTVAGR